MTTQPPTDALRLVPRRAVYDWLRDDVPLNVKMTVMPHHIDALMDRLSKAAPASPLPGGGWQDISTFTESGQGNPVIVAVPTKEGGWIVGEAWRSVMGPNDPYRGNDGWWWAGTSPGDAYSDPIRFINHGDAEWWMPLPAAPTGDA